MMVSEIKETVFANMPDKKTEVAIGDTFTIMLTTGANPGSVEYEGETYTVFNYVVADNDYEDNDRSYKMYDDKKFIVNTDERMMHMNFDSEIEGMPEFRKDFVKTNVYSAVSTTVSGITEDGIYVLSDEKELDIYDCSFNGDIVDVGQCYTLEWFYAEVEKGYEEAEESFQDLNDLYILLFGTDEEVNQMKEKYTEQEEPKTEEVTGHEEENSATEAETAVENSTSDGLPFDAENYYMFIDGLIGMLDTESYNCISIRQNDIEWIAYNGRMIPLAANYFNL